jgi:hypothetical protein
MEWRAIFGAFSRDCATPNGDSAVLAHRSAARIALRHRLTAIGDFNVWPKVAAIRR